MTGSEFAAVLAFYAVFSLFGFIGFALVAQFLPNRLLAYVAAKPAGLILFGYFIWVLGYFRVVNYQNKLLVGGLFAAAVIAGGYASWRVLRSDAAGASVSEKKKKPQPAVAPWYRSIIWIELVTFGILVAYLLIRSYNSSINGTERFMDLALMSAAGKTDFFPFIDPWYAGKTVNYYYYGSYLMSLLSNLSSVPYAVGYTIALGWLYCQSIVLSGMLVFAKTRSIFFGVLAAFLITTAGTLFYSACVVNSSFATTGSVCSYASSTRLYTPSYIINEIPSYSFTVGDLHAHMLALSFFIVMLIFLYGLYQQERPSVFTVGALGLGIATMWMINAWDAVTVSCLVGLTVALKIWQHWKAYRKGKATIMPARDWLIGGVVIAALAAVLMLPSLLGFKSPVLGLYFIPAYVAKHALVDVQWPTPLAAQIGMWGIFIATIAAALFAKRKQLAEYWYVIILSFVAVGIIVGIELFFVQDIYGVTNPPYFRANTTFKFGYHAWTLLSVAFAVLLAHLYHRRTNDKLTVVHRWAWLPLFLVIAAGLFYPYQALQQYYLNNTGERGLDGSLWMKTEMPADREAIAYINNNISGRAVIAEAVGDSYTTYARIASYTGMITPMGWKTHEWTWRFDADAAKTAKIGETIETGYGAVAQVGTDIQRLYETPTAQEAQSIIKMYNIEYVYVGNLERTTYPNLLTAKFDEIGEPVFRSGNSVLYKITSPNAY